MSDEILGYWSWRYSLSSSQFNLIYAAIDAFDVLCDEYRKEIECESWRVVFSVPADEVDVPFEPHPHVS